MHVSDINGKDAKCEQALKYAIAASHAIIANMDSVVEIKKALAQGDHVYAGQCWNELDEYDQNCLMTAWQKGGAFPASERAIINGLWDKKIGTD